MNSKLHAVCDGMGRPISLLLTEGQVSDFKGVALLLNTLPDAKELLADRGYDATWFRKTLLEKNITPCIPPKRNRKEILAYDKERYKQRRKIENMFGKLKDWRRLAMCYDDVPCFFLSRLHCRYRYLLYLLSPETDF